MIEDNRLVREGMFVMLSDLPDVEVVLAVTRLEAGLLQRANPRVVLLQVPLLRFGTCNARTRGGSGFSPKRRTPPFTHSGDVCVE